MFRIYETFVVTDEPLELNINSQAEIKGKLKSFKGSVITRDEALDLLKETEQEVLLMLVSSFPPFFYLCDILNKMFTISFVER